MINHEILKYDDWSKTYKLCNLQSNGFDSWKCLWGKNPQPVTWERRNLVMVSEHTSDVDRFEYTYPMWPFVNRPQSTWLKLMNLKFYKLLESPFLLEVKKKCTHKQNKNTASTKRLWRGVFFNYCVLVNVNVIQVGGCFPPWRDICTSILCRRKMTETFGRRSTF